MRTSCEQNRYIYIFLPGEQLSTQRQFRFPGLKHSSVLRRVFMECEVTSGQFYSCSLFQHKCHLVFILYLFFFFSTSVGIPQPPFSLSLSPRLSTLQAGRKEIAYPGTRNWYRGFLFFISIAAPLLQATHYWSPHKMSNLIYYIQCAIHFRSNITSTIYFKPISRWSTVVRFVLRSFLVLFVQNKNRVELSPPKLLAFANHSGIQKSGLNTRNDF